MKNHDVGMLNGTFPPIRYPSCVVYEYGPNGYPVVVPVSSEASEIEKLTMKTDADVRQPSRLAACSSPASAPSTTVVWPPNMNMNAATRWFAGVCSHAGVGGARNVANAIPEKTSSTTCPASARPANRDSVGRTVVVDSFRPT